MHIKMYEDKAKKYQLKVPNRPPYDYKTSAKISQITDKYIFTRVYNDIVAQMYPL